MAAHFDGASVAVLLTCFNRRVKTLACLRSLFAVAPLCTVFLVDDSSSDGTAAAVRGEFPAVNIITGTGNLFWNRGMLLAWREATKFGGFDYYLWLNDDTVLRPSFLDELLSSLEASGRCSCISGIIESSDSGSPIYGGTGFDRQLLAPNGRVQPIDRMNGNVVLVPREIVENVGLLDPVFHHDLGDVDYGYRVVLGGYGLFSSRVAVGTAEPNNVCRVRCPHVGFVRRFRKLYSPLGAPPGIEFFFRKRHRGIVNALGYFLFVHWINILPDRLVRLVFGSRYFPS